MDNKTKLSNDEIILNLKKEIELKKENLNKSSKFNPITNCNLVLNGNRLNLHTISKETILYTIAQLKSLQLALKEELPEETLIIEGFKVEDWLTDLKFKYSYLNISIEKERLKRLEDKLHNLLSNDTRISLELENIKKEI